jgi:FMN phosphatase YigB (HAD superfamily)
VRPRIGLDAGGVLIDSLMPSFPERAAASIGADPGTVRAMLTDDGFRRRYWSGDLPEEAFWGALDLDAPDPGRRAEVLDLRSRIDPARVATWRAVADVWVVSNHRHEWLLPVLGRAGFDEVVDHIEVSSLTGRVKPDPAAWEALIADGTPAMDVVVVDDQEPNLEAARSLGITAIRAGADNSWADAVDAWLASRAR